jgi:hypothetical protein
MRKKRVRRVARKRKRKNPLLLPMFKPEDSETRLRFWNALTSGLVSFLTTLFPEIAPALKRQPAKTKLIPFELLPPNNN